MNISSLKTLSNTNISVQTPGDKVTTTEHTAVNTAIIDELVNRGIYELGTTFELQTLQPTESKLVRVGSDIYKAVVNAKENISDGINIVRIGTSNNYWQKVIATNYNNLKTHNIFDVFDGAANGTSVDFNTQIANIPTSLGEGVGLTSVQRFISTTDAHKMTLRLKAINFDEIHIGLGNSWKQLGQTNMYNKYSFKIDSSVAGVQLRMKSGLASAFGGNTADNANLFLTKEETFATFGLANNDILRFTAELTYDGIKVSLVNETQNLSAVSVFYHPTQNTAINGNYTPFHWGELKLFINKGNVQFLDYSYSAIEPDVVFIGNSISAYPSFTHNLARQFGSFCKKNVVNYSVAGQMSLDLTTQLPADLLGLKNKTIILNGLILTEVFFGQMTNRRAEYTKLVAALRANNNTIIHVTTPNSTFVTAPLISDFAWMQKAFAEDVVIDNTTTLNTSSMLTHFPDGLHPNKWGASLLLEQILGSIENAYAGGNNFNNTLELLNGVRDNHQVYENDGFIAVLEATKSVNFPDITGTNIDLHLPTSSVNVGRIITLIFNSLGGQNVNYVNGSIIDATGTVTIVDNTTYTIISNGTDWKLINSFA